MSRSSFSENKLVNIMPLFYLLQTVWQNTYMEFNFTVLWLHKKSLKLCIILHGIATRWYCARMVANTFRTRVKFVLRFNLLSDFLVSFFAKIANSFLTHH